MLSKFLKEYAGLKSQAAFVDLGYAQVEPNHLSAQRTAQIYAQLPAASTIKVLEQGQFVKYDYATGVVNFTGKGEWMLVYNEIKLYREHQLDCEFAMVKDNYGARVYSPYDPDQAEKDLGPTRFYANNAVDAEGEPLAHGFFDPTKEGAMPDYSVAGPADYWEMDSTTTPFASGRLGDYKEKMMPKGTTMVPRVFKTNVGDIFTTNCINETEVTVGELLTPQAENGILAKKGAEEETAPMLWQVVKVYTLADGQKAAKIMRVK